MVIAAIVFLAFGAVVSVAITARHRFRAMVTTEVTRLFSSAPESVGSDQLRARWNALPQPVRRYFDYAAPNGAPAVRTARLKHDGFLRTAPDSRWLRVDGEEYFTVAKPGFVWAATAWPGLLLWFDARDCLLSNGADMLVKLYSALTIAHGTGPEMYQGARLRWLAENVWFPYGFIGDEIEWEPIDDRSARMTLRQDGLPVSAIVEIDDEGKLTSIRADRYRAVGGGKSVLTPWFGRCSDYRDSGGFRVPWSIEVGWTLEEGEFSAIRFRVTALDYNGRWAVRLSSMMRFVLAALLFAHGIAHLVGFVVPWRLVTSEELPYRTTVLAGSVDLGETGVRLFGIVWLAVGLAFVVVAGALLLQTSWWYRAVLVTVLVSLALCVVGWPDSRLGIVANALILGLLIVGVRWRWFA